ncbi:MAG: helix-turn-helix domain-containing protein [Granulosicoccus sp.]|nr:helix-turn-helix domain-containing protein [Granulosicoccus sp.]
MSTNKHSTTTAISTITPWFSNDSIDHVSFGHTVTATIERDLDEHEHLFLEGEDQTHVYLVVEGVVGLYKLLADGRRQISTFAYPGDIIGLDSIGVHGNSGEALSHAVVRCIPVNAIEKLIRSEPGFGQALLYLTASELAETREQMLSLGRKSAAEKVATFLIRISRRSVAMGQTGSLLSIPMKRSEIADFLGLTIETVSRTFTKLKVARVIRLRSNSQVEVLEMEKLSGIAEGNSTNVIH